MNARWLASVAVATVVRRVVGLLLVGLLAYLGAGEARAACVNSGIYDYKLCDTQGEAWAYARSGSSTLSSYVVTDPWLQGPSDTTLGSVPVTGWVQCRMRQTTQTDNPGNYVCHVNGQRTYWKRGADCAAGETWNSTTKTCVPDGPTDEECQAINAEPGFLNVGPTSRSFESRCMANGCIFAAVGPRITVSDPTGISVTNGTFEWTGACASPPAACSNWRRPSCRV